MISHDTHQFFPAFKLSLRKKKPEEKQIRAWMQKVWTKVCSLFTSLVFKVKILRSQGEKKRTWFLFSYNWPTCYFTQERYIWRAGCWLPAARKQRAWTHMSFDQVEELKFPVLRAQDKNHTMYRQELNYVQQRYMKTNNPRKGSSLIGQNPIWRILDEDPYYFVYSWLSEEGSWFRSWSECLTCH